MANFDVVVTVMDDCGQYEIQCCNCNHKFKEEPKTGDVCPGCKEIIGQIEYL